MFTACVLFTTQNIEGNKKHSRYLDLGNGSNKFGNHCSTVFWETVGKI